MNLFAKLSQRAEAGKPIRIGVGARIADRGYELQLCSCSEFPHAIQVP
jgi:predicted homoserine dehydrogenase-like protein